MIASQIQTGRSERPSSAEAYIVNPETMSEEGWEIYARMIEPVTKQTAEYTLENLIANVKSGDMQPWTLVDPDTGLCIGAMATRLVTYESGLYACILVGAATEDTHISWEAWRGVADTIESFARVHCCDVVRVLGRRGWARMFKDYTATYVCMEKRVAEVH